MSQGTTVITYRGAEAGVEGKAAADAARPVVCELSELEVFSCVLGLEEETALSILEPAALHAQLRGDGVLHVSLCLPRTPHYHPTCTYPPTPITRARHAPTDFYVFDQFKNNSTYTRLVTLYL